MIVEIFLGSPLSIRVWYSVGSALCFAAPFTQDKERKQLKEKFEDAKFKFHHRSLGNIKLIGALILLKVRLYNDKIRLYNYACIANCILSYMMWNYVASLLLHTMSTS